MLDRVLTYVRAVLAGEKKGVWAVDQRGIAERGKPGRRRAGLRSGTFVLSDAVQARQGPHQRRCAAPGRQDVHRCAAAGGFGM